MTHTLSHFDLNAMINLYDKSTGTDRLQLHKDKEALHTYFREHVNKNTVFFHTLEEKLEYLVNEQYYEPEVIEQYEFSFIKRLFKAAYNKQFRFESFVGAYKYYTSYTLKTFDGQRYLERYEDRVCMSALYLARGDEKQAFDIMETMISSVFQPATPTFLNTAKKQRGELVSCFLVKITDCMESISRSINAGLQLSKRGGGVAFCMTDIRETGAPIKKIQNQSSGIIPIMKLLEDAFSYANQLGARQGAGAVYLNAHHPDILQFLDTKRENADEKIRIKTLSTGVVIPDITFELAKRNEDMYLFSPYDIKRVYGKDMSDIAITDMYHELVDNPEITKSKISARGFFETIAELQFESGYPYEMFEDTVNRANPIAGRINMSNLCVAPETMLLTDHGDFVISSLEEQTVNVWNGEAFTETVVRKTGEQQKLFTVTLEDDRFLECTEYHKWYVTTENNPLKELRTHELMPGMVIAPSLLPDGSVAPRGVVESVIHEGRFEDTYCVTEKERGMAVFNGILTGNCSEILQVNTPSEFNEDLSYKTIGSDISCNLGSMNIAKAMEHGDLGHSVEVAVRALTAVSEMSNIASVPSIEKGNNESHAIGLGQMNLHGFLAKHHIHYGSPECLDFTNLYFYCIAYHAYRASNLLAIEKDETFVGFEDSQYATGEYFDKYVDHEYTFKTERVSELFEQYGIKLPTQDDWVALRESVKTYGLYNRNLQAIPPTGSISYINNSTASIHPIAAVIEARKEGKLGRVYYPAPYLNDENIEFYRDAYAVGPEAIIDTYAEATKHVDQGLSLTLFFPATATTRDITKAQIYAWRKGIKTLYYSRIRQDALEGTEVNECVACTL